MLYARGMAVPTPSETEIRRLRARELHGQGVTFAEIGREVGVSVTTVKKYCRGLGLPDNQDSRRAKAEAMMNPRSNELARLNEIDRAFTLRLEGLSVRAVAIELGRDHRTISRWIDEEIERRISPKVEKLREMAIARLDEMSREAWAVLRAAPRGGELRLKALDRLIQIERRRAATIGSDSPVRVDAVLTERTQADLEMEELLREAQARNSMIEGEILSETIGDPDPPTAN